MAVTRPRQVVLDGVRLARMVGEPNRALDEPDLGPDQELVMSRFAWMRRDGASLLVETSLGAAGVVLEEPRAHAFFVAFTEPQAPNAELARRVGLPPEIALELVSLLHGASLLIDRGQARLEHEPPLAVWEFHDLLFHARSRSGRSRNRSGGTYRFLGRFEPAPAIAPTRWGGAGVLLERPDLERLEAEDPPLTRVQSKRTSIRHYGERPPTFSQLSEFLYRVGRVEDYWEMRLPGAPQGSMSFAAKPYPSGGAAYELELYLAVRDCQGLEAGFYRYDGAAHRLEQGVTRADEIRGLFVQGAQGMGIAAESMQVLITITARFSRVAWKYESIAYELVLKHVGVLLQTMYLAATAMGLAPCAIGSGDSDLFARASGIDYYEETAVGEFALGSRARHAQTG